MSIALLVNGVTYDYPQVNDTQWGPDATDWASAVTSGMLQKAGGLFQLLAEVDFGTSYGVKSLYYKSRTANIASTGVVRLARADEINWRNQANSADLALAVNSSDQLTFDGTVISIAALTAGSIPFSDGSTLVQNNANLFWDEANTRLGLLTNTPSYALSLGGNSGSIGLGVERASSGAGNSLTINSGGAQSGATDANGGTLVLRSGISTGTGQSRIQFRTYQAASSTGSSDNADTFRAVITEQGNFGIGSSSPTAYFQVAGAARSASVSATGVNIDVGGLNFTDSGTAGSGTLAAFVHNRFATPTLNATNSSVTTTLASNLRVNGGVNAGTNETIVNSVALLFPATALSGTITNTYQLYINGPMTGGTNNYAASITGNVGLGGVTDPNAPLSIAAQGVTVGTDEQISLRSQRAAIVAGNMIGGLMIKSNDTSLSAPGTNVALIDAIAEVTHTASALGTCLAFQTTTGTTLSEKVRITGAGNLLIGNTNGTNLLSVGSSSQFNVNSSGVMTATGGVFSNLATNGFVKTSGGTGTLTVQASVPNSDLATMAANTVKANVTGGAATPTDVSIVSTASASAAMIRDSSANVAANNVIENVATTATAAGTTTLTVASAHTQQFTGSTTQTVVLPDATTLSNGHSFLITNRSTGTVTVNANGGTLVQTLATQTQTILTLINNGTAAGTWDSAFSSVTSLSNPMTNSGDIIYGGALGVPTALGIGSNGQMLGISSGIPAWKFPTYRSVTTTDSPSNADDYLVCSGASFTITLPTAVGFTGKAFTIIHNGTSFSQVYTLNTTGGQTIGGVASGSYALYTLGESLTIFSNGANWLISEHKTAASASYTPTITSGTGSVTNATASGYWFRAGDLITCRGRIVFSNTSSAFTRIIISLPITIDTTKLLSSTVDGVFLGDTQYLDVGTAVYFGQVTYQTTTTAALNVGGSAVGRLIDNSNTVPFTFNNADVITWSLTVPVSGWQP